MRETVGNWYTNKIRIPQQLEKSVMEPGKDVGVQSDIPVNWSREATLSLLSAYEIQRERLGKDFRFKNYMWIAIALALKNEGKNFTPAQCENRWRVLVRSYRRTMDNNSKSARRRKDFEYQEEMQRVLKDEDIMKPVTQLSETGAFSSGDPETAPSSNKELFIDSEKSNVNSDMTCSEPEPATSSNKQLFLITGKPNVNSDGISSEPEPATSSNKQLFLIRGKSSVNSDGISSESQPASSNSKNFLIISAKPNVNSGAICRPSEPESSLSSTNQLFIITGKPCVNNDRVSGEPKLAPSGNKQLFIVGKPSLKSDKISSEPKPTPGRSKQLFIVSGKPNVNSDSPNVNSDRISSEPEPTPSSNDPEPTASSSKQLFTIPSKSSPSPPEKSRKLKRSFLQQIRADRKLYYEKKLEVDKDRLEGLEKRNDELLQLKKLKLQQMERMVACEEEKLKCEKEKLSISSEKLKMYVRLVQLQEESNDILRSINDQFDFLL